MRYKARLVDCAEYNCGRTFATRSLKPVQYCPDCRRRRKLASKRERKERAGAHDQDELLHDPDFMLAYKLDNAEFTVLHDAGPEGEAFRPGARLTGCEVRSMLQYESLAVNSLLLHNKTQTQYYVVRGAGARLVLTKWEHG